jgi:small GTP-binding protein
MVLLGEHVVGKSTLLVRCQDRRWDDTVFQTTSLASIEWVVRDGDGQIKLQIWDTPGQDKYAAQGALCCREAACCIIVYDITRPGTYTAIPTYSQRYEEVCHHPFVVIAGNKVD